MNVKNIPQIKRKVPYINKTNERPLRCFDCANSHNSISSHDYLLWLCPIQQKVVHNVDLACDFIVIKDLRND